MLKYINFELLLKLFLLDIVFINSILTKYNEDILIINLPKFLAYLYMLAPQVLGWCTILAQWARMYTSTREGQEWYTIRVPEGQA